MPDFFYTSKKAGIHAGSAVMSTNKAFRTAVVIKASAFVTPLTWCLASLPFMPVLSFRFSFLSLTLMRELLLPLPWREHFPYKNFRVGCQFFLHFSESYNIAFAKQA